jgi:hypothetical protein
MTRSPAGEVVTDSGIDQCSDPGAPLGQKRISVCACSDATEHSAMPEYRAKRHRSALIAASE